MSTLDLLLQLLAGALAGEALHRALERGSMLRRWQEQHRSSAEIERFLAAEMIRAHPDLYNYLSADLSRSALRIDGRSVEMMTRILGDQRLQIPAVVMGTKAVKLLPSTWTIERDPDWSSLPHIKIQKKKVA
jgi:hypothetical protein